MRFKRRTKSMNRIMNIKQQKNTANLQLVKETNLTSIYNLILKHEPISRAELAQITRLSPTTVSSLVEDLLLNKLVVETGAGTTSTSGRKPIMLEINPQGRYVISIEVLEDRIEAFAYDLRCIKIGEQKHSIENFNKLGETIILIIEQIIDKYSLDKEKLSGISIGVPALIDCETKTIISSTVLPLDGNVNLYQEVKEHFKNIILVLENESCLFSYAEQVYGKGTNASNLVFIDINVGIGSGIIINGNMYTGAFGMAGEIGHISIDMNGPKCKCGNRGCLELMASIPALIQKVIFGIMSGRNTIVSKYIEGDYNRINIDIIKMAIDENDEFVLDTIDEIAMKLSFGINNIINLYNPEVIVIGGEITKLGGAFLDKITHHLKQIELLPNRNKVKVYFSGITGNGSALGGARFVLDRMSKTSGIFNLWR